MSWIEDVWNEPRFEPVKRRAGGNYPTFVGHRFPIKGGITLRDVLLRQLYEYQFGTPLALPKGLKTVVCS